MRKGPAEIAKMRKAGRVVAEMHQAVRDAARPGVTTAALDRAARDVLARRGARSNFLGYAPGGAPPFPGVICASPNDMIVHGIPSESVVLDEGDIVSIDCGAVVDGWHGDAAFTMGIGEIKSEADELIAVTRQCLDAAISRMVDGGRLSDIGDAVQTTAEAAGFGVVRGYGGHAIGTRMHEDPHVPNLGPAGRGPRLRVGQVYAIEPMVNAGSPAARPLDDGWSVVSADGSLSAHWEHTVAITDHGPEVLTLP